MYTEGKGAFPPAFRRFQNRTFLLCCDLLIWCTSEQNEHILVVLSTYTGSIEEIFLTTGTLLGYG